MDTDDLLVQLEAQGQIEALRKEIEAARALRAENLPAGVAKYRRQHEDTKKAQLKSDLKKCTAFSKKIKVVTSDSLQQCIKDIDILNLSNYVSEIASAVTEANYKIADVPLVTQICIGLHRRYDEFTAPLLSDLRETLLSITDDSDKDVAKKKRIQLRLFIELFHVGLHDDEFFFVQLLTKLVGKSRGSTDGKKKPIDLAGLQVFIKFASEVLAGYTPSRLLSLARQAGVKTEEVPSKCLTTSACCKELQILIEDVYETICGGLQQAHKDLCNRRKKSEKDIGIHGNLSELKQAEMDQAEKLYEKLMAACQSVGDAIGKELPVLKEEKEEVDSTKGISVYQSGPIGDGGVYGDVESKSFYEDLPDLLSMVPLSALGLTAEQVTEIREKWRAEKEADHEGQNADNDSGNDIDMSSEGDIDTTMKDMKSIIPEADSFSKTSSNDALDATDDGKSHGRKLMELIEEKLPDIVTKQKADDFSTSFCYVNSKASRKKLASSMMKIPRNRMELIPNYARVVTTLNRIYGDVGDPIVESLFGDFYGMYKARSPDHLQSKLKNVKYVGELIKFKVAPPIVAFKIFKLIFHDFSSHNIEILGALMESCGRYLYLSPHTHYKMEEVINTTNRLKKVKNLDQNQVAVLEAAIFTVIPPEPKARKQKKPLTLVQQYIHHLIKSKLEHPTVESVLKSLRKLPWSQEEECVEFHVIKASLSIARKKYVSVSVLADCLSGLSKYKPNTIVLLVDRLIEELTRGLEMPRKRQPQRMLSLVRLLGELYNYSVLSSPLIFEILYLIINHGHELVRDDSNATTPVEKYNPKIATDMDPPSDCFRPQLVCELLNTSARYFMKGPTRGKLKTFLILFQRYLLSKPQLPAHVEFDMLDLFDTLEEFARKVDYKILKEKEKEKGMQSKEKKKEILAHLNTLPILSFPRFDNYDAVQMEVDKLVLAGQVLSIGADGVEAATEEEEESDDESDDDSDNDNTALSEDDEGSVDSDDSSDDSENSENDEDDGEDDEENDGEDEYYQVETLRIEEEDEEFDQAFRDMMIGSIEAVKAHSYKTGDIDKMVIPTIIPKAKNVFAPMLNELDSDEEFDDTDNLESDDFHIGNDKGECSEDEAGSDCGGSSEGGDYSGSSDDEEDDDDDEGEEEEIEDEEGDYENVEEEIDYSSDDNGDEQVVEAEDAFEKVDMVLQKKKTAVTFKLLSRDNKGRIEARNLLVPEDSQMVMMIQQTKDSEREEKQRLKERVLGFNEKYEEIEQKKHYESLSSIGMNDPKSDIVMPESQDYLGHGAGIIKKNKNRGSAYMPGISGGGSNPYKRTDKGANSDEIGLNEFLAAGSIEDDTWQRRPGPSGANQGGRSGTGGTETGNGKGRGGGQLREFF